MTELGSVKQVQATGPTVASQRSEASEPPAPAENVLGPATQHQVAPARPQLRVSPADKVQGRQGAKQTVRKVRMELASFESRTPTPPQ